MIIIINTSNEAFERGDMFVEVTRILRASKQNRVG